MKDESLAQTLNQDAANTTGSNQQLNSALAPGRIFENSDSLLNNRANNGLAVRPIGSGKATHTQPRKDLNENIKHGTSVFPFAAYIWEPQNFPSRVTLHWHKEVELVRFSKGRFKISVDMHDLVVENDAFLLLPGNIMHTFDLPSHSEESAIVFDPKMLVMSHYDEVQSELFDALLSSNIPIPPIITPEHPAFSRIDKLYRYCARHGATKNASHRLLIKAKLLEIIALYHEYGLLNRKEASKNVLPSKQDKLKDLLNYIDSHFAGPMTIRDASLRLGVTDQYFCRYFKKVTGMSFTEYLGDLRLRRAAKDIELTTRPISDIAFENGFENTGYFFKSFKSKFGVTPLRYRKHYIEENLAMAKDNADNNVDYNPTLSPIDIDHTSAAYNSDMNVNKTAPSIKHNHEHHTDQGTITFKQKSANYKAEDTQYLKDQEVSFNQDEVLATTTDTFSTSTSANNHNSATPTHDTSFLFEDEDEYDLHSSRSNIGGSFVHSNIEFYEYDYETDADTEEPPVDSYQVQSHFKTRDEIHRALKMHSISHLDALDNEEDLFDDDEIEEANSTSLEREFATNQSINNSDSGLYEIDDTRALYPNGLNSKIAPHKIKGSPSSDSKSANIASRENSTAKKTVFALQERLNLDRLSKNKASAKSASSKSNLKNFKDSDAQSPSLAAAAIAKKTKQPINSKISDQDNQIEEEFWFDDQGNLRSKINKRKSKSIIEQESNLEKSASAINNKPNLKADTTKAKAKTPSEIRDKIAELERKKNDPFGL